MTRTAVSVQAKDAARKAMMAKARELAMVVRARPATTDAQLQALGLRVRRKARRAVSVPGVAPRVRVKQVQGAGMSARLVDRVTGKAVLPARGWKFALTTGAPRFRWVLKSGSRGVAVQPGERAWLVACWVNERGERGPWSEPADWWVDASVEVAGLGGGARRAA